MEDAIKYVKDHMPYFEEWLEGVPCVELIDESDLCRLYGYTDGKIE